MRAAARQAVVQHHGFRSAITAKDISFNIERAAQLKVDHAFARPVRLSFVLSAEITLIHERPQLKQLEKEPAKRTGLYRNRAIGDFINSTLFQSNTALGVKFSELFGKEMPKPTIALALTMVRTTKCRLIAQKLIADDTTA